MSTSQQRSRHTFARTSAPLLLCVRNALLTIDIDRLARICQQYMNSCRIRTCHLFMADSCFLCCASNCLSHNGGGRWRQLRRSNNHRQQEQEQRQQETASALLGNAFARLPNPCAQINKCELNQLCSMRVSSNALITFEGAKQVFYEKGCYEGACDFTSDDEHSYILG